MPWCERFGMLFLECKQECKECGRVIEHSHTHSILTKSGTEVGMISRQFRELWEASK